MRTLLNLSGIVLVFLLSSCSDKLIPLQQTYQEKPYEFSVASSKEKLWPRLIDLLTARGMSIETIDKNSGVITTGKISFIHNYTFEAKEGGLMDPEALVVCTKVRNPFPPAVNRTPSDVTGQWALVVKETDNKTFVDINLANAVGKVVLENSYNNISTRRTYDLTVKSTGAFEKSVEDGLK